MTIEELPAELQVALAYALPRHRETFATMLGLDFNLGCAVSGASEVIVGQMRLAWWRDALSVKVPDRPKGNPLLDRLTNCFGEEARRFDKLVDGWEALLTADPLDTRSVEDLVSGRQEAWECVSAAVQPDYPVDAVRGSAKRWALAELAAGLSNTDERAVVLAVAESLPAPTGRLPRSLRPLAILDALARRSLARGAEPLMTDRMSSILVLRVAICGR